MEILIVILLFVLMIAINIAIIRWVLRINDIVSILKDIRAGVQTKARP